MEEPKSQELWLVDELAHFVIRMQFKLDLNKDKDCSQMNPRNKGRSWKKCSHRWLLYRLRQETLELEKALACGTKREIEDEAADVANFAMFIYDTAKAEARKDKD